MNTHPRRWKTLSSIVFMVMLAFVTGACSNSTTWKEEAVQHDGSKIIVERSMKRGGPHEIGSGGGSVYQSLTFLMPGTGKEVVWEDKRSEDLNTASFSPLALNVVDSTAYVVASPAGCLSYNKWGRPNPPYVVFKHQGQDWSRIPLEQLPATIKSPNLIISSPDEEARKLGGVISAKAIEQLNATAQMPQYVRIVREPANETSLTCPAMVPYGRTGWLGLDWFTDQPSLGACLVFCADKKVRTDMCPCNSIFQGKQQ